ncbi:hypothetical protein M5K25_012231 [Dendrobium thyrsiflorum]|uniref:Maturase K n=1 Tax=Dendrobium thyrsiflorum TaxID=117978 RepID=A0ABD0UX25_DENTH
MVWLFSLCSRLKEVKYAMETLRNLEGMSYPTNSSLIEDHFIINLMHQSFFFCDGYFQLHIRYVILRYSDFEIRLKLHERFDDFILFYYYFFYWICRSKEDIKRTNLDDKKKHIYMKIYLNINSKLRAIGSFFFFFVLSHYEFIFIDLEAYINLDIGFHNH